eukprot:428752_1
MSAFFSLQFLLLIITPSSAQIIDCLRSDCFCPNVLEPKTCTLNCKLEDGCKDNVLRCRAGDPCIVNCDGHGSCQGNSVLDAAGATDVQVFCNGDDACKGNTIINCGSGACAITCAWPQTCQSATINAYYATSFKCIGNCHSLENIFTFTPTRSPTNAPSAAPTILTSVPTTSEPTTRNPTQTPSESPTNLPSSTPSESPTNLPSISPTRNPSLNPTINPTQYPSHDPTEHPTNDPSINPTNAPTIDPTNAPTIDPTPSPTGDPTLEPTFYPTLEPTVNPTMKPTLTFHPTSEPSRDPTYKPSRDPTYKPTDEPSRDPTSKPTDEPSRDPTYKPSGDPTYKPSFGLSNNPVIAPTKQATNVVTSVSINPSTVASTNQVTNEATAHVIVVEEVVPISTIAQDKKTPAMDLNEETTWMVLIMSATLTMIGFATCCCGIFFYYKRQMKATDDGDEDKQCEPMIAVAGDGVEVNTKGEGRETLSSASETETDESEQGYVLTVLDSVLDASPLVMATNMLKDDANMRVINLMMQELPRDGANDEETMPLDCDNNVVLNLLSPDGAKHHVMPGLPPPPPRE